MSNPQFSQQVVDSWLCEAANILRGPVHPAHLRDFVFPPAFLKRLSDKWDEEQVKAMAKFGKDLDDRQLVYLITDGSFRGAQFSIKRRRSGIQVEGNRSKAARAIGQVKR